MTRRIIADCDFCGTSYEYYTGSTFKIYLQTSPHMKIEHDLCPECTQKIWLIKREIEREAQLNVQLKRLADQ